MLQIQGPAYRADCCQAAAVVSPQEGLLCDLYMLRRALQHCSCPLMLRCHVLMVSYWASCKQCTWAVQSSQMVLCRCTAGCCLSLLQGHNVKATICLSD
jgi:hypothetical protein